MSNTTTKNIPVYTEKEKEQLHSEVSDLCQILALKAITSVVISESLKDCNRHIPLIVIESVIAELREEYKNKTHEANNEMLKKVVKTYIDRAMLNYEGVEY